MIHRTRRQLLIGTGAGITLASVAGAPAIAQATWPTRPIRLVVPQAAGGGSDTIARFVAERVSAALQQSIVVENKPGAAGMLGAEIVKNAAPDGYTMLLSAIDTITAPIVSTRKPFDGVRDFAMITQLTASHNVWLVGPSFTGSTMAELVAAARANPGKIDYASSGVGSMQHLAGAMLARLANVQMNHVPYRGGPPAFADVVGGRIPAMVSGMQGALPQIKGKKVRALAVTGKRRTAALPDVPTVAEALGLADYEALNWQALLFPRGTPQPIVDRMASAVIGILRQDDVRKRIVDMGYEPIGNTPAEFAAVAAQEQTRWATIIQAANITSE
jgi:tripartite-type tricarboxylate transporter receptor subunit TctC